MNAYGLDGSVLHPFAEDDSRCLSCGQPLDGQCDGYCTECRP